MKLVFYLKLLVHFLKHFRASLKEPAEAEVGHLKGEARLVHLNLNYCYNLCFLGSHPGT
jgi:hypothetical protein